MTIIFLSCVVLRVYGFLGNVAAAATAIFVTFAVAVAGGVTGVSHAQDRAGAVDEHGVHHLLHQQHQRSSQRGLHQPGESGCLLLVVV